MTITIHNLHNEIMLPECPWDVIVDRRSVLGNKFRLPEFTRDDSCNNYEEWFLLSVHNDTCIEFHAELLRLRAIYLEHGKLRLFCWCAPLRCHAETIRDYLKESGVMQERNVAVLSGNVRPLNNLCAERLAIQKEKSLMAVRAIDFPKAMRTIIAGSRDITEIKSLTKALKNCGWVPTVILSGAARGADYLGELYATMSTIPLEKYPADWDKYGKSAGYKRNEEMAKNADALIALWDGKSKGTKHMIDLAKQYGLQVYVEREENQMQEMNNGKILHEVIPAADLKKLSRPVLAFDTETELITYTSPLPDLICATYSDAGTLKGSIETPWEHTIDQKMKNVFLSGQHSVGHNVCFDLSILMFKYPDLLPYIFDALDKGTIHDTLIREKLLNLTLHGNFETIEINGAMVRMSYALDDLEKKYLNIDRSDLKHDADAPRMNYYIYKGVPLAEWGEKFITYAVDDAVNTGLIYALQEEARQMCIKTTGKDPFAVETFRVKISFALRLLECIGDRMDPKMVLEVTERFQTEYNQPRLRLPLLSSGLLLDAIPPQPYANGALAHTEVCDAMKDDKEHKKARKDKTCGCPPKMKGAIKEVSPQRPLFQYIWNLAATDPNFKAWPSDGCASELRKAGLYENLVNEKAFLPSIIRMEGINESIANLKKLPMTQTPETKAAGLKKADIDKNIAGLAFAERCRAKGDVVMVPDDIKLKTDEEWVSTFAHSDPLLSLWAERKALRKIITEYLPKMYYTDENGVETPATILRGSFYPLCLTGRSSSSASKFYPSRNQQNVDPRVRPCTIPRDGNIIVSTDYSGMELGTLAQKCFELFGHSVLADKINAGIDTHAFLAAQIAAALDPDFGRMLASSSVPITDTDAVYAAFDMCKDLKEECNADTFCGNFRAKHKAEKNKDLDRPVMWGDFFKYFRLLAKPTGLGFPGGMAPPTVCVVAKASYKLDMSLEVATAIRKVWLKTYPEMGPYLEWIKKSCRDPQHSPIMVEDDDGVERKKIFYAYDTPRGMHRSRCGYCEAANGAGLQAISAEGALEGLYRTQKAMWLNDYEGELKDIAIFLDTVDPNRVLLDCFLLNFIHDENLWESPEDDKVGDRARVVEKIMVDAMEEITPNVKAGAESAAMRRWSKYAEAIWNEKGNLIAWEPEPEKKGI